MKQGEAQKISSDREHAFNRHLALEVGNKSVCTYKDAAKIRLAKATADIIITATATVTATTITTTTTTATTTTTSSRSTTSSTRNITSNSRSTTTITNDRTITTASYVFTDNY